MTQSTSHPSAHNLDFSNATQYTPNTGMYMGRLPWPQLPNIPHPGFYYPYGAPPNAPHGTAPPYAPVVPSPGVDAEAAHHAFQGGQNGYYPPAVADVSGATYVGPYPPQTEAVPPPQHSSAPPLYHQPFPSSYFPGAPYAPDISYQAYPHQHHGPGLATGSSSSSLPQAPSLSVSPRRVAGNLEDHNVMRVKMSSGGIQNDPFFKPVLDQYGQHNGTYVCSKDGMVIRPGSHKHHIKTAKHLGYKLILFKCPLCPETYTRRDACKRHWDDMCGKLAPEGARLSYSAACKAYMSSTSVSPVGVPTAAFTCSLPTTATTTSDSSPPETTPTVAIEDATTPDSLAANGIQDPAFMAPVLPPSEVREITLAKIDNSLVANEMQNPAFVASVLPPSEVREITIAEVHGDLDFWRWINNLEDYVVPISDPSSRLPETMLAEAAEDPDVWSLINEIEDFVDPELPLCESSTDAAEDPEFCHFPIRTLLICSWLNDSYGRALRQRSPSELTPLFCPRRP